MSGKRGRNEQVASLKGEHGEMLEGDVQNAA